ncbi:MAG: GntR family transcriptional regulator [Chloroflexi bacterium]|nr:GntR family transcriptional regulator [Chloroflexota bacterium]
MKSSPFQSLDFKTLRNDVTNAIREAILKGDILPGQRINQVHIAEKLGTSRGPVREALGQLEEEGLIRNIPYKGTFVIEVTPTYLKEVFSIRRVLEGFAIRRAIERATPEDLKELRETVAKMRLAAAMSDLAHSSELDLRFHYLLCRSAHHSLLLQMWKSIEVALRLYLAHRHRVMYEDPRHIIDTHPDILGAIEAADVEQATQLLDSHIREAEDAIRTSGWLQAEKSQAK